MWRLLNSLPSWLHGPGRCKPGRRRSFEPSVEPVERRELLSSVPVRMHPPSLASNNFQETLSQYLVFKGKLPIGHGKSLSFNGPIVLAFINGQGQVIGTLFNEDGSQDSVKGLAALGGISIKITTPSGETVHAAGMGVLRQVHNGFFGYDTLLGRGDLMPLKGPIVFGGWQTSPPPK